MCNFTLSFLNDRVISFPLSILFSCHICCHVYVSMQSEFYSCVSVVVNFMLNCKFVTSSLVFKHFYYLSQQYACGVLLCECTSCTSLLIAVFKLVVLYHNAVLASLIKCTVVISFCLVPAMSNVHNITAYKI